MTIAERKQQVYESVYRILEVNPETRDDDRALMLKYWSDVDGIPLDGEFSTSFLERATSPESISRARRSVQQKGFFPPTSDEVKKKRRVREEETRAYYAQQR